MSYSYQPIKNADGTCSVYIYLPSADSPLGDPISLSTAGSHDYNIPYSALVPEGETKDIHVTHASMHFEGPQVFNQGMAFGKIEAPAGSGNWKIFGVATHGFDAKEQPFSPGIVITSADEVCVTEVHAAYSGINWWGGNAQTLRIGVWLHYVVGP